MLGQQFCVAFCICKRGVWGLQMRNWLRATVVAMAVVCLSGCAEFRNRGGVVDDLFDKYLFIADTKGHRVLRSYLVTGSLIAYARQSKITLADRQAIAGRMFAALEAGNEAFNCAYESETGCIFFDEKMLRFDYAIYKLALAIFLDTESKEVYAYLRDRVVEEVPVIGRFARGAVRATQVVNDAAGAVYDVSEIIDKILYYSFRAVGTAARIGSLYRDAIEMDMVVVTDHFAAACEIAEFNKPANQTFKLRRVVWSELQTKYSSQMPVPTSEACVSFVQAYSLYQEARGDFRSWQQYLSGLNGNLRAVVPTADHFFYVSRLIYSSCASIMNGSGQNFENCAGKRANADTWVLIYGSAVPDLRAEFINSADTHGLILARDPLLLAKMNEKLKQQETVKKKDTEKRNE
jgi:hypothetical protein